MKRKVSGILFMVLATVMLWTFPVGATNVALNSDVTLDGVFSGVSAGTIVDGAYLPNMTQWQSGTVWWTNLAAAIEINLGAQYVISALNIQADNNDVYGISYWSGGDWVNLWQANSVSGFGMMTRPNPLDNLELYDLLAPVTTNAFKIQALQGDFAYSVSEFQAASVASTS